MQIQELMALIEAHVPALGAELQRAAAWVARNPRRGPAVDAPAGRAGGRVTNSMARLAQALGYEGYGPFRQVFQDALGHGAPAYKERVRRLQGEAASQFDDALLRTHLDNARSPTVANAPKDIARAVQRMRAARRLYFLGTRSCFAISYHFAYAYSMIAGNGVLVHGLGGTYPDQLDAAGPEDLLVCVTQNPYGRQTLEAARDCRQAGVPVLALTDNPLAPIQARHAGAAVRCRHAVLFPFDGGIAGAGRAAAGRWPPPAARPRNSASTPSSGGWTRPAPISAARRRARRGARKT